ncbi:hypothetical protein OG21DRAFT_257870 [Imleria badia]|nr:hypothetical protein OG21DRAFT_257870 [Imleria badia]
MSTTTQLLSNGTYLIFSGAPGTCLVFIDNQSPPQIWHCSGQDVSSQQLWEVQALSNSTYSVKNLAYNSYISTTTPNQQSSMLLQSQTPYGWYMNEVNSTAYGIILT